MNKKTHSQVFDSAAREHIPDHVDLAPQIMAHIQKGKGVSMNPKLKLFATVLTVIVTFAIVFATGPTVVHALQKLFGYIPGVGIVASDGSLRVLVKPASQTKGGTTVTIQKGTIDSNRTILVMNVTGLDITKLKYGCPMDESSDLRLRLPDGTKVKATQWTGLSATELTVRYYFPALSADVTYATLEIPCLVYDASLKNWEIPLQFGAVIGMNPSPVIEIDPASPGAQSTGKLDYGVPMTVTLEQVIPLEDGYILQGSMKWGDGTGALGFILDLNPETVQIVDGKGNKLAADWTAPDNPSYSYQTDEKKSWAFKVSGKEHAWPLTVTFANIQVERSDAPYPAFPLDMGPNPQIGQTWMLNQDVRNYSNSAYSVHLNTATYVMDSRSGKPGMLFDLQTHPDVLNIWIEDVAGDGAFYGIVNDKIAAGHIGIGYAPVNGTLSGKVQFMFTHVTFLIHGNWQVTWQP